MNIKENLKYILNNSVFSRYKLSYNKNYPWAISSYITLPYYLKHFKNYLLAHQNRETSLIILEVFKSLSFNVFGISYKKEKLKKYLKNEDVKIIFGIEPNFINLSNFYPESLKIYFATGAYYEHQNRMIIMRTDEVNQKKKSTIKYARLVPKHKSNDIADYIFQIGSKFTLETYPEQIRRKIRILRQNTFEFLNYDENIKKKKFNQKTFLWFGGTGAILKGLDLVLDFFSKRKDYILHVVGPVEKDFQKVYEKELFYTDNIYYHGFLKITSKELFDIALESTFIILPSASEGGCPGSVLNMLRLGMVPIVSKWAAFDSIEDKGILIEDLSIDGVSKAVNTSQKFSREDLLVLFKKNSEFISNNYNSSTFYQDLRENLLMLLEKR
jgi:hypothetical protein